MTTRRAAAVLLLAGALPGLMAGCKKPPSKEAARRAEKAEADVRKKYGKAIDDLPGVKLVLISPHNTNIQKEFSDGFRLRYALEAGKNVDIEWRDVGGGGSAIVRHLRNVYGGGSDTAGIDVLWGGGDYSFRQLAKEGLLQSMEFPKDFADSVPATLSGMALYDKDRRWCGTALSAFGFIYNRTMLKLRKLPPPRRWEDLARPGFHGQIALGNPTQSSSSAAAFEVIVQSAPDWPSGWARLLDILGNCGRFTDGASGAADAPVLGEALAAACIDFYGTTRVAEAPDELCYLSPEGQTAYTPDAIAILKNPPHPKLAQAFVHFVLSKRGQALWALPVGHPHGPVRKVLGRLPIRGDVYEEYAGKLSPGVQNPYKGPEAAKLDINILSIRFDVLKELVRAAAIDNADDLRKAKKRLIDLKFPADRVADFHKLPDNVDTPEDIRKIAELLKDAKKHRREIDIIVTDWTTFFREKYRRLAG